MSQVFIYPESIGSTQVVAFIFGKLPFIRVLKALVHNLLLRSGKYLGFPSIHLHPFFVHSERTSCPLHVNHQRLITLNEHKKTIDNFGCSSVSEVWLRPASDFLFQVITCAQWFMGQHLNRWGKNNQII